MRSNHISPLKAVWLKNSDGTRTSAQVIYRKGGVYQIELPGNGTRLVNRNQLVRRK